MKKRRVKEAFRQGDVIFIKRLKLPKNTCKKGDNVIAHGELTGHKHQTSGNADVYVAKDGTLYVDVKDSAAVTHEEHGKIELPSGTYQVRIQREYDPSRDFNRID